jgi:hypothetical protein
MCDGTDDPDNQTLGQTNRSPNQVGQPYSLGAELGQPNQVRQPSRTGTAQPSGTAQAELGQPSGLGRPRSELGHSKDRLSQSGPGRPSPLGRPTQTWSGPIFSRLLRQWQVPRRGGASDASFVAVPRAHHTPVRLKGRRPLYLIIHVRIPNSKFCGYRVPPGQHGLGASGGPGGGIPGTLASWSCASPGHCAALTLPGPTARSSGNTTS